MKPIFLYILSLLLLTAYVHVLVNKLSVNGQEYVHVGMMEIKDGDKVIYTPVYQKRTK